MERWVWEVELPINHDNFNLFRLHKASGIYAFLNADREYLYIGQSTNIDKRIKSHFRQRRHPVEEIEWIFYTLVSDEYLDEYEMDLIFHFMPKWNRENITDQPGGIQESGFAGVWQNYSPAQIRNLFQRVDLEKIPTLPHCSIDFAAKVLKVPISVVMEKIETNELVTYRVKGHPGLRIPAYSLAEALQKTLNKC